MYLFPLPVLYVSQGHAQTTMHFRTCFALCLVLPSEVGGKPQEQTTFYLPGELASWTTCYSGNKSQCVMQRRLTWCEMPANNLSHPAHADQSQLTILPWNLAQGRDHFPLCPIQPWRLWRNHHPWFLRILTHKLGHQLSNCIHVYIMNLTVHLYASNWQYRQTHAKDTSGWEGSVMATCTPALIIRTTWATVRWRGHEVGWHRGHKVDYISFVCINMNPVDKNNWISK